MFNLSSQSEFDSDSLPYAMCSGRNRFNRFQRVGNDRSVAYQGVDLIYTLHLQSYRHQDHHHGHYLHST